MKREGGPVKGDSLPDPRSPPGIGEIFRLRRRFPLTAHYSLFTSPFTFHPSLSPFTTYATNLSISAKPNTVTLITPFMVKNAASSRDRSPGFTR